MSARRRSWDTRSAYCLADQPQVPVSRARKSYDGKVVLDNVTSAFPPGAKIGVVGPNGMGKSTLLRMMAGLEQPSNGEVRLTPGVRQPGRAGAAMTQAAGSRYSCGRR
jgi:ABC-type Mn2+/Zn2+ transport system ATPase subunit